jgi:hypothetical protein
MLISVDTGELEFDKVEISKQNSMIEARFTMKDGSVHVTGHYLKPLEDERDVKMTVVKQENSIFATREQLLNLEKQFRLHSRRERNKAECKDEPESTYGWFYVGKNTSRLWRIAKEAIKEEDPSYIRNDDSDEAILFLVLSRYISDRVGYPE